MTACVDVDGSLNIDPDRCPDVTASDEQLLEVAQQAACAGGAYLRETFRTGPVTAEYGPDDVSAVVDREAERRVAEVIRKAFPHHGIYAEESGQMGRESKRTDTYQWFVDPLDGTNNFASGLATFATAVAVRRAGKTRAAAIYEPIPDDLYLARRGCGATVDGETLTAESDVALDHGTISLVIGPTAIQNPRLRAEATRVESALRTACKRVLQTWSPCVDWGLLARGGTEGLVAFYPASYERHAGELLAAESGAASTTLSRTTDTANPVDTDDSTEGVANRDPLSVAAGDEATLADLVEMLPN